MATWTDSEERSACVGKTDVFFPLYTNTDSVAEARDICRKCPLYERCVEYWLPRYEECEEGILFGYSAADRRHMASGLMEYRDWRNDARVLSKKTIAALERHANARGVKAVVDLYNIYDVETEEERQAVLDAYRDWLNEQHIHADQALVQMRADHHRELRRKLYERNPEYFREQKRRQRQRKREARRPQVLEAIAQGESGPAARLPEDLRPECPNGHGRKDMAKRRQASGTVWVCYLCKAKVAAEPEELVQTALRAS